MAAISLLFFCSGLAKRIARFMLYIFNKVNIRVLFFENFYTKMKDISLKWFVLCTAISQFPNIQI